MPYPRNNPNLYLIRFHISSNLTPPQIHQKFQFYLNYSFRSKKHIPNFMSGSLFSMIDILVFVPGFTPVFIPEPIQLEYLATQSPGYTPSLYPRFNLRFHPSSYSTVISKIFKIPWSSCTSFHPSSHEILCRLTNIFRFLVVRFFPLRFHPMFYRKSFLTFLLDNVQALILSLSKFPFPVFYWFGFHFSSQL